MGLKILCRLVPAVVFAQGYCCAFQSPMFSVDRPEVSAGQSATLTWSWPAAAGAYISAVGIPPNPKTGSMAVQPSETTEYVIAMESTGRDVTILSQRVVVRGAKGSSSEWPPQPFLPLAYEKRYQAARPFTEVAERIRKELANFEVQPFKQDETLVFLTAYSQRPEINNQAGDARVRKIAYRVALSKSAGSKTILVAVSASIYSRPRIDKIWHLESPTSSDWYPSLVDATGKRITGD